MLFMFLFYLALDNFIIDEKFVTRFGFKLLRNMSNLDNNTKKYVKSVS